MKPLGWQQAPQQSLAQWDAHVALARAARGDGLTRALVCGMGGSSLAPQVLAESGEGGGAGILGVLDSTNPAAVQRAVGDEDFGRTLFLVVSKSGTTVETLAFYHYFATRARPRQFIAITDPGTPLEALAHRQGFRAVIAHPPDVGGRYAALTAVGMVPAALMGIDGGTLLQRASRIDVNAARGLGRDIAAAARAGCDKLVLHPPLPITPLAYWIEQLVAESSGKNGRGVVPVVQNPVRELRADTQLQGPEAFSADPLDLGAEFLRWEYATQALCEQLGVNPFDQPDVEDAKRLARAELEQLQRREPPAPLQTLSLEQLRRAVRPGDYLAMLVYAAWTPALYSVLQPLRAAWDGAVGCVTTVGIGPRYLHSTGQLHKGGPNTGVFLVVTVDHEVDFEIPTMGTTFGQLHHAQARGDVRALLAKGRRVAHVHLRSLTELEQLHP